MNEARVELLKVIEEYEQGARILPASGPEAALYFSALQPTIESALSALKRLVNTVVLNSRQAVDRFRQTVSQARALLRTALADAQEHALVCVFDLLRGAKRLLQDLIHQRLVDEDRVLAFGASEVESILAQLKFPPRKGSKLRAVLDAA